MSAIELNLTVGSQSVTAFFYDNFFTHRVASSSFHKHRYCEIHFTESKEAMLYTQNTAITSAPGTITAIPAETVHRLYFPDQGVSHRVCLINYPVKQILQSKVSPGLISDFFAQADEYKRTGNPGKFAEYAAFLCKDFIDSRVELLPIRNREFLICEFFVNNYNKDVCIADLAELLCVSEKQANRLVVQHMGDTFGRTLTKYRIEAAKMLQQTDKSLTLSEISQLVGYQSYSGFWKAMQSSND